MNRIPAALLAVVIATLLSGCAGVRDRFSGIDLPTVRFPGVYRTTIQQGNVVTQEMVDRLRPGMTRRQVRFILGEPVAANAFRADRWDYVYTIQVGSRDRQQQTLTLWFEEDSLARFEGDFLPTAVKEAQERALEQATRDAAQS